MKLLGEIIEEMLEQWLIISVRKGDKEAIEILLNTFKEINARKP